MIKEKYIQRGYIIMNEKHKFLTLKTSSKLFKKEQDNANHAR